MPLVTLVSEIDHQNLHLETVLQSFCIQD